MIAQILANVLTDAVFRWATSTSHAFEAELVGYMERQGLVTRPGVKPPTR
jgi:hypothetical protein